MNGTVEKEAFWAARPLLKALAYGGYFVVALLFFVWWRLPETVLKETAERLLHDKAPQLDCRLGKVTVQLPLTLVVSAAQVTLPGGAKPLVLTLDRLAITPLPLSLAQGTPAVRFNAALWQGQVEGTLRLPGDVSQAVDLTAEVAKLVLPDGEQALNLLGREVRGKLSGKLRYRGRLDTLAGEAEASLTLLTGGINLAEPLFGVTKIDLDQVQLEVALHGSELALKKGVFRSKDLAGELSGSVALNQALASSTLQVEGWCEMYPSFFVNLHLTGGVEKFLKQRSRDGKIAFALQGALAAPQVTLK